jgi:hypothetical protein
MTCPSVAGFWEFNAVQNNGAIFPWEPLAEEAINLEPVRRGQNFVRTYLCRFAAATTKLTPMRAQPRAPASTSPTLGRAEQVRKVEMTLAGEALYRRNRDWDCSKHVEELAARLHAVDRAPVVVTATALAAGLAPRAGERRRCSA